ncbi:hypothetical protein CERZMDRAFT_88485 [Cercospora zeae-maydis SCOH1-5]|uniref:Stc1 domain-containing protein n=1 Tax=Cercospora zeae-maydis SCOH1-5 TaxID=717836 RepID=A0A6A6F2J7_9PEZI|nr:hypothetical protein CERZMDRAFT_88485 [Cercospora zeae-maydis SCOH1-5]
MAPYSYASTNSVAVPGRIKCGRCGEIKGPAAFSIKQRGDLAEHMRVNPRFNAASQGQVSCIGCTTRQVVELHCSQCDLDKGLDKFSKAQRRDPDNAICWKCAEDRANYEPGAEEGDDSSGGDSNDSDYGSDDDDFTISAETGTNSASGIVRGTYSSHAGVSLPPSSTATSSKAPSSVLRSTTNTKVQPSSGGGKFAKVKAVPRKVVYDKATEERDQASDSDKDGYVMSDSD